MHQLIVLFTFSFGLIFGAAEIDEDLIAAMQKISENRSMEPDKKDACKNEKKKDLEKRVSYLESCLNAKSPVFERCDLKNDSRFFLSADFLYWLVKDESSFYFSKSSEPFQVDIKAAKSHYKPGFRVALGYDLPHDNWDIYLDWTWIKSMSFMAKKAQNYGLVGPVLVSDLNIPVSAFNSSLTLSPVDFAKTKSGIKYSTWDFEIGKLFYPGTYFSLRPFVGLRGAFIKEVFGRFATSPSSSLTIFPISNNLHEKFWAIGLRSGLGSEWNFCKAFGLYGNFSAALLFCKFKVENAVSTEIGSSSEALSEISRKDYTEIKPTMQAALGFLLSKSFCKSVLFSLRAGYEINYYWDCVNFYDVSLLQDVNKALELSGLTVGMKMEF